MKKISAILFLALVLVSFSSCGSSKKMANKAAVGVEIDVPLSGKEYQNDNEYWRYTASGVSPDMSVAKEIAVQAAREQLAASVKADVELVADRYAKNFNIGDKAELVQNYERQAITAVKQTLVGSEIIGEKMYRLENGNYKCFVCMQLSKQEVVEQVIKAYENEEKIRAEFDQAEFRKIFEKEIGKLK